ncbi:MAG: CapA family protein [Rhodospirillales bacterium]|nr:CapA family protein [Rhodospirillales bacterium]
MSGSSPPVPPATGTPPGRDASVQLFLSGDVMLGRGIDQILPHPGDPLLHERFIRSATDYVRLAEAANGPIPRLAAFDYVWGETLPALARASPAARIINLETSVTRSAAFVPKGINYRMNPDNVACLTAAAIDCCVLANNHVLDFGRDGLLETLGTLHRAGIKTAGAGRTLAEARQPAIIGLPQGGRLLVFAFGHPSSGIPAGSAAQADVPGIDLLENLSDRALAALADRVSALRRQGDLLIASIHWSGNWGYAVSVAERHFAHGLIDIAGFDLVHGHSSHHPKPIELYRDRLILYGCGDFLNDYEGISGYEEYRGDLALAYLPRLRAATGRLLGLRLIPFRIARFRLHCAAPADTRWLQQRLAAESRRFGLAITLEPDGSLEVYPGRTASDPAPP